MHLLKKNLSLIILLSIFMYAPFFVFNSWAQTTEQLVEVDWNLRADQLIPTENALVEIHSGTPIPFIFIQKPSLGPNAELLITDLRYDSYNGKIVASVLEKDFKTPVIEKFAHSESGNWFANLKIMPLRVRNGQIEKLTSFRIQLKDVSRSRGQLETEKKSSLGKASFADNSVLGTGDWFKIAVGSEGIYKIDASFLRNLGLEPSGMNLASFKIYGESGSLLPEPMANAKYDDLSEIPVKVIDNNLNDQLDEDDLILFYAQAAGNWVYNTSSNRHEYQEHYSSAFNYLYLTFGGSNGKRLSISPANQGTQSDTALTSYDHLYRHDKNEFNFLQSGRDWWGNSLKNNTIQTFEINLPGIVPGSEASFKHRVAGRSTLRSSYSVSINSQRVINDNFSAVSGDYAASYHSSPSIKRVDFEINAPLVEIKYEHNKSTADGDAWIDYFELVVPRNLVYNNEQTKIFTRHSFDFDRLKFEMTDGNFDLWDVTDLHNVRIQETAAENNKRVFVAESSKAALKYIAFKLSDAYTPEGIGRVENQNLHSYGPADYVIVTHPSFEGVSEKLAEFHRNHYGHSVHVVTTEEVYNEYGSGKADPSSIRNFVKMIYDRGQAQSRPLKYLLLFGDGSYDFKDYTKNNTNFVPTFQSRNSFIPTITYSTDDYYAILEDHEGYLDQNGAKEGLDLGVGRIPAGNVEEANVFVEKIIRYHGAKAFGDWRNRLTFLGDDEDGNQHFFDTEVVTAFILSQKKEYNVNKIYLDAFEQISFGSGQKYPEVNVTVNKAFDKGHLIFNYLGHGGGSGMAHERVITREQILSWNNTDASPLVITATCELSRFDDPAEESPGELMLFDNDGGAIGLITTTRLVIIGNNSDLNEQIFDENIFFLHDGEKPTIGQVYSRCKNKSARNVNQRNFILLGDPAMKVAYPEYKVVTTSINDSLVGVNPLDTLKAFEKVKVTGAVMENGQIVTDFNGFVYPTIFDKFAKYRTLANDPESYSSNYRMQSSVLYRGKVSVINGEFSFQFIVPKDIAYEFGTGKISYYAENGVRDGHGFQDDFFIGGSGQKITDDDKGPDIELYLDNESFVFGGTTNTQPVLYAELFDENGVNTVGNGIGRDLLAIIDEGTDQERIIVLNDFYTAKLDSYQEGEIQYEMEPLSAGRHTLKIKVWDVYNNSSEAYTEFIVAKDDELSISHVLNYPNPFTTNTSFHFDHNKVGQELDITLKIFSVAGNIVKSFAATEFAQSGHFQDIAWDGRDEYGDRLARGVYLYKLNVKSEDGTESSVFQKLLLLK